WTLVTFSEQTNVAFWDDGGGLSIRLDHAQEAYHVEMMLDLYEELDPSLPRAERRAILREHVRDLSWSSVADLIITLSEIFEPPNERSGSCEGTISTATLE